MPLRGAQLMKTFILLPTGIADRALPALEGRTPLEAAHTPGFDRFARAARIGRVRQVPQGWRQGSENAVLSVLGYDPRSVSVSRGGLEALALGIELGPADLAFRINFVSTFRGRLVDFSAGHIGAVEARLLIEALQAALGNERDSFHAGLGYRNVLVVRGARDWSVQTEPPQEALGQNVASHLPTGPQSPELLDLLERATRVLMAHDVNRVRVDLGENPADRIWPWGAGGAPELEPFFLRTGLRLAVVAAVPLVRGLGLAVGATVPQVPGATGQHDTPFAAKLQAALAALEQHDVVLLHLSAANEASHATDARLKVRVIEEIDRFVLNPLLDVLSRREDVRLLVTSDHATPTHAAPSLPPSLPQNLPMSRRSEPDESLVPFGLWGPGLRAARPARFVERDAAAGELCIEEGHALLEFALRGALPGPRPAVSGQLAATEPAAAALTAAEAAELNFGEAFGDQNA
ncbi:MAG: 2,3-bisphosphoglycerate-independent phosphoglycerate mutase [Planctomycetota bacterium]